MLLPPYRYCLVLWSLLSCLSHNPRSTPYPVQRTDGATLSWTEHIVFHSLLLSTPTGTHSHFPTSCHAPSQLHVCVCVFFLYLFASASSLFLSLSHPPPPLPPPGVLGWVREGKGGGWELGVEHENPTHPQFFFFSSSQFLFTFSPRCGELPNMCVRLISSPPHHFSLSLSCFPLLTFLSFVLYILFSSSFFSCVAAVGFFFDDGCAILILGETAVYDVRREEEGGGWWFMLPFRVNLPPPLHKTSDHRLRA